MYPTTNLTVLFTIYALLPSPTSSTRATFGEFCDNRTIRCDSAAFLTCRNGTCTCLKSDAMTFSSSQSSCVALAGEKCKFTVVEEFRSWLEEVGCVQNAKCSPSSGICACDAGFMEMPESGVCSPKRVFGQGCNSNGECRDDLKCVQGQCKCDPEQAVYDFEQQQCVGLADAACLNERCTENAICRGYYGGHSIDSYEEYSGEDTKCVCSPGYTKSPEGLCQVGHGGACDLNTQCLDKLKCQEGTCTCPFQGHQTFQEAYQDCYSLIGGPCTPNISPKNESSSSFTHCVKPAICLPNGHFRFECACPEGMVENAERSCDLTQGRICSSERSTSGGGGQLKCDTLAPLFCIQGKCQCEDEFKIYDPLAKRCRGLVGSNCDRGGQLADNSFCVDGAFCKQFRGSDTKGRCECSKYFVELRNRTCSVVEVNNNNMLLRG